uniref:Ribosomal protein S7 n=1 Tax=Vischeria sp. CAUP Q 202 TaxID=1805947 RepID=A0A140F2S6_9STRA|nr:ribosomal protein S7 [Vischeria punctata]AML60710.1 ribosomal protein S7 [Vischeria sp. CAUP Q 202]UUA03918.1 ribosomal protein S7 [Vischeria punctata]
MKDKNITKHKIYSEREELVYKNLSTLVNKFVNQYMKKGKKEKAQSIFRQSVLKINLKGEKKGFLIFLKALKNVRPLVHTKNSRRGGATYQIPVPLSINRSFFLAIKILVDYARKKKGCFVDNLNFTLIEAANNKGECVKKREDLHNKVFKNKNLKN